jgi:glycosyltransferase involved in cell wall biosynthesis
MRVEITIPVYNEENDLPKCIDRLSKFLAEQTGFESSIVIADNASTDRTWELAQDLTKKYPNVNAIHIPRKGRGLALRTVWTQSTADIVSYMDVDLSTDVRYYPLMVQGLGVGYDIAIGSRLMQASRINRSAKREFLSRGYNILIKSMFWAGFSDAQCGFKAMRREVALRLLPHVKNNNWFFDCEMLLLADRHALRIFEVPVEWTEDTDTRATMFGSVVEHFSGLLRMRFTGFGQRI